MKKIQIEWMEGFTLHSGTWIGDPEAALAAALQALDAEPVTGGIRVYCDESNEFALVPVDRVVAYGAGILAGHRVPYWDISDCPVVGVTVSPPGGSTRYYYRDLDTDIILDYDGDAVANWDEDRETWSLSVGGDLHDPESGDPLPRDADLADLAATILRATY